MKIYRSDVTKPITATARKPEDAVIPPWSIPNRPRIGALGEWSPKETIQLEGMWIKAIGYTGVPQIKAHLVKNNAFTKWDIIGFIELVGASQTSKSILFNQTAGQTIISPYDSLQVIISEASTPGSYNGITIQPFGYVRL